jgi:pimeloyl-ACP methyl ester carboxylesterase
MELKISNYKGEKLSNEFIGNDSKCLAIMVHGFAGNKNWYFFDEINNGIIQMGFDTFRFDFSGNGKSAGKFSDSTISKEVRELTDILKFFRDKYKKIVVIAHSMGCAVSLMSSEKKGLIDCIILMNPLVLPSITFRDSIIKLSPHIFLEKVNIKIKDIHELGILKNEKKSIKKIMEDKIVGNKFIKELPKIDVIDYAEKLSIPILIIHGKKDPIIPYSHIEYLYNNIESEKKLALLDYGHEPKKSQSILIKYEIFKFLNPLKEKFLK